MNHKKSAGFTLIEVLAAMTLLSLAIFGVASAFIQSRQIVTVNGVRQTALQIAQQELNKILADSGGDISKLDGVSAVSDPVDLPANAPDGSTCYKDGSSLSQNKGTYTIYIFTKDEGSGTTGQIVTVRVYYGAIRSEKYVELYNSLNK